MKSIELKRKIALCLTLVALAFASMQAGTAFAQTFELPDEDGSVFEDSKVSETMTFLYWAALCAAGLLAVILLIKAGTYASRGDYGKTAGSVVGAVLSGTAAYLVFSIQS